MIIFLAVGMLPGDIAQAMLGQSATSEIVAAFARSWAWICRRSRALRNGCCACCTAIWALHWPTSGQPRELSGGQKQRICIARALAADPQLLICDEVTSALDQWVAEGVLKLLNRIQQQLGVAYLFITHDVATVRAIADEVVVAAGQGG